MQGPEVFLNDLGITVNCVVNPQQKAKLDTDHRVFVNWETYYFSNQEAQKTFKNAAYQFTGPLTDPVSAERFQPNNKSPFRQFEGRLFYFQNQNNALAFENSPEDFVTPVVGMKKM